MKMGKKRIIVIFLLGLLLVGYSFSILKAKKNPKYVWKWASLAQDTVEAITIITVDLTQSILKATDGDVKCVWYMGGIMGDEEDYVTKMRIGQLHGAMITGTANASVCPGICVMELPFLFENVDEARYVQNKLRPKICKIAEKNGFKVLMLLTLDEHFYSVKYPMRNPQDFQKSKILTWHGPLEVEVLKALGASPIPVNVPEVVPSMRAGVVDGAISPSGWWLAAQLYTITKYINPLTIRYDQGVFLIVNKEWNKLPLNQRKNLEKMWRRYEKTFVIQMDKIMMDAYKGMVGYGCTEVKMTPKEIEVFRKRTRPVWDKMAGKEYPRELLNEVLSHLKQYRGKKGGSKG
ncbi:MAG: TRAP transporter substrate-binding protein DctP [Spirochaetota bacterium]|nr:TRAP transporter substrate-binding protein DctP [Spirochaetota bacterium]